MIANRMKPVLAAAVLVAAFSSSADSRDRGGDNRGDRDHRQHRVENSRWDRQGDGHRNRPSEIDNNTTRFYGGSISSIRRFGTYAGATDVFVDRGNGIYFDRDVWPVDYNGGSIRHLAPKAKIINVDKELGANGSAGSACSFEAGVCVIRGGR